MLASVAWQAAFAVENAQLHEAAMRDQALKRELAVAHEVQRGFLPSAPPRIPEYDFFEFYEPANQVGGDYYDYIELPGGRLAVVVADVSGKGISASLLMAKLSAEIRYCLASEPTPAAGDRPAEPRLLRQRLGRSFRHDGAGRARSATHEVTVVNAGHLPPLLASRARCRSSRSAEPRAGLPLGVDRDFDYAAMHVAAGARRFADPLYRRHHRGHERRRRSLRLAAAAGAAGLRRRSRRACWAAAFSTTSSASSAPDRKATTCA